MTTVLSQYCSFYSDPKTWQKQQHTRLMVLFCMTMASSFFSGRGESNLQLLPALQEHVDVVWVGI